MTARFQIVRFPRATPIAKLCCLWLICVSCFLATGCTAILSPISGVPAHRLPAEFLAKPKNDFVPIDISRLRQTPQKAYLVDAGDTLGIYIEGVFGNSDEAPPVHFPDPGSDLPPSIGFPVQVREDGTLSLPLVKPISVRGMRLGQVEDAIRFAYTVDKCILHPDNDRITVTIMRKRRYRILVLRQDTKGGLSDSREKNTQSHVVELPAYKNDVLNALAESGGLPGLSAKNEVQIFKTSRMDPKRRDQFVRDFYARPKPDDCLCRPPLPDDPAIIRIPLRLPPGEVPQFGPEDVVLDDGDIVSIESRDTEIFYTGGLLPGGEFRLPRDYDLDVLAALAIVGQGVASHNQVQGFASGYGGRLSGPGLVNLGGVPPGQLFILRKTPCNGQITIAVDLNRAVRSPAHRLLIQPGDTLILRYKPQEEVVNFSLIAFFTYGISELFGRSN